jgi:hypothetical protein
MAKDKKKASSRKKTVDEMPAVSPPLKRTVSSPVYPAVTSDSLRALEPVRSDPPPSPPLPAAKAPRKGKAAASWAIQVAVVAIPAIISGYFTRQTSKDEAEAGYKTMVVAVEELQDATKELVKQQAYLQGELDAMRNAESKQHGTKPIRRTPPPDLKTVVTLSNLPQTLDSAMKVKGPQQPQSVLSFVPMDADGIFDKDEKSVLSEVEKKRATALEELQKRRDEAKAKAAEDRAPAAPRH